MHWFRWFFSAIALIPSFVSGPVGRDFVSVEALVGLSRSVQLGTLKGIEPAESKGALSEIQEFGEPHRVVFEVKETIRGGESPGELNLVLSLQSTHELEYLRDHRIELMLAIGPGRLHRFPRARVGIEEEGKRVDGDWYHFRAIDQIEVPGLPEFDAAIATQLNLNLVANRAFCRRATSSRSPC